MLEKETKESNKKAKLLEDKLAELREKIADLERDQQKLAKLYDL